MVERSAAALKILAKAEINWAKADKVDYEYDFKLYR